MCNFADPTVLGKCNAGRVTQVVKPVRGKVQCEKDKQEKLGSGVEPICIGPMSSPVESGG